MVLNDLEEENIYQAQKSKGEDQRKEKEVKRAPEKDVEVEKEGKRGKVEDNEEEEKCICGKVIQESFWIQCSNEAKCRGSGWYHLECAGIKAKPEEVENIDFVCSFCKRNEDDKESESSHKKFKSNWFSHAYPYYLALSSISSPLS